MAKAHASFLSIFCTSISWTQHSFLFLLDLVPSSTLWTNQLLILIYRWRLMFSIGECVFLSSELADADLLSGLSATGGLLRWSWVIRRSRWRFLVHLGLDLGSFSGSGRFCSVPRLAIIIMIIESSRIILLLISLCYRGSICWFACLGRRRDVMILFSVRRISVGMILSRLSG